VDFQCKLSQLRQQYATVKLEFVNLELDLAITYCVIAANTVDPVKSNRNMANAERAYDTAAYFLDCKLNRPQKLEIKEKLMRFRSLRASCDSGANMDNGLVRDKCQ